MGFKRLLAVGLLALFSAGTAMAASQLNSVQVTSKASAATITLQTTGSYSHKEYRPDEHLVLIDLTVTANPAIERMVTLNSALLKSYKLSHYTSSSGSEVTRLELELGDGVGFKVVDRSDGLQLLLSSAAAPAPSSAPDSSASPLPPLPASTAAKSPGPALVEAANPSRPAPATAAPVAQNAAPQPAAVTPAAHPSAHAMALGAAANPQAPIMVRSISVQRGHGTLDVIIDGPTSAHPFLLNNPDRLVMDFNNAVVTRSVKNIAVHTRDVLQVRVGRFQSEPPVTRVVVDLSGPHTFDVVAASQQVIVRIKTEDGEKLSSPLKPALEPAPASAVAPVAAPVKPAIAQNKTGDAGKLSLPLQPAPAPAPVSAVAPAVAPVKPALAQIKADDAGKLLPPRQPAPAPAPASAVAPVVAPVKPALAQIKADDVKKLSPSPQPAPAPALASVVAPVVAPDKPAIAQIKTDDAVKLSSPPQPAPAPTPVSAVAPVVAPAPAPASAVVPVVAPDKPAIAQIKTDDAVKLSSPPQPAPAPAPVSAVAPVVAPVNSAISTETPVTLPIKPAVLQAKTEDAAALPPRQPAPAPTLASAEVPAVAGRTNPGGSGNGAYTELVSAPSSAQAGDTAAASTSQLREQQMSDPKARAVIAADTMAMSPKVSEPPAQSPGNATATSSATPKYTGEPISVNLKDVDLKDFFRLIHEISGLNIVLDPNVKGSLTLVLDDVPWDQALDIVLRNNALDRELQGNVLRIAATDTLRKEAVDRRAQSEAVALAVDRQTITRFLSYAKAKEIVPTVKKFLTARGDVISDERTNALIISDIPSVLPNLDRLISQLDKKSQEVEIEVRVVSAQRSFTRDLGVQLGFNWGNGVSTVAGTNPGTTTTSTTTGNGGLGAGATTTTTGNGTTSLIPLFTNLPAVNPTTGISFSNLTSSYGIDAILTAAENHNLAKVLSRPRVVTQSNVKAEVKQGLKIPVYTQGTDNANASVSYVDAVLRLSVTPQITADGTIFLTVDVENTQPDGTINSNYILQTQQATTQVLVTDGGTVVIGGVIQTTNTVSTSQTPFLGNIPLLGNLFKERFVHTETDELIFFITPKIIQT